MNKKNLMLSVFIGLMSIVVYPAFASQEKLVSPKLGNFTGSVVKNSAELIQITSNTIHSQWKRLEKRSYESKISFEQEKNEYIASLEVATGNNPSFKQNFVDEYLSLRQNEPLSDQERAEFMDIALADIEFFPKDPNAINNVILHAKANAVWTQIITGAGLMPAPESTCTIL